MSASAVGAVLGLVCAVGITLVVSDVIAMRGPSLLERFAPFVPATPSTRAIMRPSPSALQLLGTLLRPLVLERFVSSPLDARLVRAGRDRTDQFRLEQALMSTAGACTGLLLGFAVAVAGAAPVGMLVLAVLGAIAGALIWDRRLSWQAARRQQRIAQQLPVVAELIAFAVAAGESPVVALDRVRCTLAGDLADEFETALTEIRAGAALDMALRSIADRSACPSVERFVDGFILAIERGSPLAEVLRAQAADARAAQGRALIESAGRKDVAMLVPVVFFILPTVVLIAIFPGLEGLHLVVP